MHDLDFAAVSHRGVVRAINQDSIVAVPPVFAVADGIGGADAGEVASSIVAGELDALARAAQTGTLHSDDVAEALQRAHQQVAELSSRHERGAASTAAGCVALETDGHPSWLVFNVGDSRVYRCHGAGEDRRIRQVSVDHSAVQELVEAGLITRAEAATHPDKNVVTRAVGAGEACEPDFWVLPMVPGDRFVVCSDGLLGDSDPVEVRDLIKAAAAPTSTVDALLELALRSGARDNVSVVVVDVHRADGADDGWVDGGEELTTVLSPPDQLTAATVISQRGTIA